MAKKTKTKTKTASAPSLDAEPGSILAGEAVTFSGDDYGITFDDGSKRLSVRVDFGDGTTRRVGLVDGKIKVSHAYDKAGSYDIRVLGEREGFDDEWPVLVSCTVTVAALGSQN